MKKRIILRSCLISLCAVLIVFCASVGVIYANSRSAVKKNLREEIAVYAALVKDDIHALEKVPSFGETRITIVGLDGAVLFDSKTSGLPETNHLEREEIAAALKGQPTFVERYSDTLGYRMMYYAVKVNAPTPFVLRIAERSSNFWAYVGGSVPFVLLAMLLALGLSYVLARQLSAKVAGQMREVCESLRSIGKEYRPINADMSDTETYSVLEEINSLSDELRHSCERADEERSKLDFVANHVTQGIVALDARGKLVYVNSVARALFNEAELGKHYIYLFDDQGFYTNVRDRLSGADSAFLYSYRGADLSVRMLNVADAELSREISVMLIVSDVTKENAALRQKAEFFANASHELKTPLTSLQGLSELLLANAADPASKKQLERIHTESKRLNALVLDMLYISNLENHALIESKTSVELGKVAAQVIEEYRTEIEEKQISVSVCGRAELKADVRQMAELFGNLVGNAVHYNKQGGAVSVALTESADKVRMTVVDTGIGIAAEHIPKLCERFYRVDKSRSKKTGGTGLGLAIVKHIALSYGGGIEIQSAVNVGTTVIVTLSKSTPDDREYAAMESGAAEH